MQTVSQAWLVLQLTGSPFRLGLLGTLQFGPILLLSVVSGALADRIPARRVLLTTQSVLAAQALALGALVATGHAAYWQVATLALLVGLANVADQPARQAFVMRLVGKDDVVSAVTLNSAAFNGARIIGPAIAGLLIAEYGVVPGFVANGVGFLVVIAVLRSLEEPGLPARPGGTTMREEIVEGLGYAARNPRVRLLLGLLFVVSLCVFNFTVYVPLLARTVLRLGPEGFGFLMTALGVGAVAGALTLGARGPAQVPTAVLFGAAGVALSGLLGLAAARHFWVAVPLLFVTGFAGIVLTASCNTTLQLGAPEALRGRVMSLYTWIAGGVFPVGAFLVGAISERWGVSRAFLSAGLFGLIALAGLGGWWRWRAGLRLRS
jgi:predicted MFS family arabinose efflux permease